MILENLKLRGYRNLNSIDVSWHGQFNVVYGQNAQGKTNLLEAIYLLGHLKSFRGARGSELIEHNTETAWVGAQINRSGVQHHLEIGLQKHGRTPRVDKKTVKKLSEFFGYLQTVIFTPEELGNIKGYPAGRRALLDRAILQKDPLYLDRMQEYEKVIRQRNQLLKHQVDDNKLLHLTEALIKIGSSIQYDRLQYLESIRTRIKKAYKEITGGNESADIRYSVEQDSLQCLSNYLREALQRLEKREKKLGLTLAGPHRDDIEYVVDDHSLRTFGSQGQQRSFLLAFKAAQIMDMEDSFKETPVLLLDDLASELDLHRQEGFFNFLFSLNTTFDILAFIFLLIIKLPKPNPAFLSPFPFLNVRSLIV